MTKSVVLAFVLLVCTVGMAEWLCPYTKVEESFNMQAMHDFLFATNVDQFDHHAFPGVVPRTFLGAWLVSFLVLTPFALVAEPISNLVRGLTTRMSSREGATPRGTQETTSVEMFMRTHTKLMSHMCRGVLGCLVLWSLWAVTSALFSTTTSTKQNAKATHTDRESSSQHDSPAQTRSPRKESPATSRTNDEGDVVSSTHLHAPRSRTSSLTSLFFCLLCAGQFHIIFYATRALPNTFGLVLTTFALERTLRGRYYAGVTLLSIAAALFRCDVVALLAPYGLYTMLEGARKTHDTRARDNDAVSERAQSGARGGKQGDARHPQQERGSRVLHFLIRLLVGVLVGLASVGVSVAGTALGLDSFLWRRWLWPEGSVLLFNTVSNKSEEWGVSPAHWYWTRALPRALLFAFPIVLWLAVVLACDLARSIFTAAADKRDASHECTRVSFVRHVLHASRRVARAYRCVLVPALTFIALYSALPHKELRFVLVVFPWLLAPVAAWLAEVWAWPVCTMRTRKPETLPRHRCLSSLFHTVARAGIVMGFIVLFSSCAVSVLVSAANYPGGTALDRLESIIVMDINASHTISASSPVTVFIDAYAAMSGVNRFQKTFLRGHRALPRSPHTRSDEAMRHIELYRRENSLWRRWTALARLPAEALLWRSRDCLGPVQRALTRAVQAVRDGIAHRHTPHLARVGHDEEAIVENTSACAYALSLTDISSLSPLSGSGVSTASPNGYVRYLKDPALFLTTEEVHAKTVAARTGRAGPISRDASAHVLETLDSRVTNMTEGTLSHAVYRPGGIDYALVRASQWELHLTDHGVFDLVFVQLDESRRLLTSIRSAIRTCVAGRRVSACVHELQTLFVTHIMHTFSAARGLAEQGSHTGVTGESLRALNEEEATHGGVGLEGAYLLALRRKQV